MAHLTDELRSLNDINGSIHVFRDDLDKIADKIDKRHHEECLRYWSDGCACGPDIPNSVRLPLDANGIPINVGDWTNHGRVGVLSLSEYGQWTVFTLDDDSDFKPADICIVDPTPKQVLLVFAERMQYGIGIDKDDLINDTLRRLGFEE